MKKRKPKRKTGILKVRKNERGGAGEEWFYEGSGGRNIGQCRPVPFVLVRILNRIRINYS